jgi:hypothetical protein
MTSEEKRARKAAWQRAWKKENPEQARAKDRVQYERLTETERRNRNYRRYGITVDDYDKMLLEQGGRCAICPAVSAGGRHKKHFHIDHCHKTGVVRGLLCNSCNTLLGSSKDSVRTLQNAIAYLKRER